jgi:hypothetical protein
LKTDQNWANEYEDSISVIYVRKSGN